MKDVIQRTENLDLVPENEHEEAIHKIGDRFKAFGVQYYEYHKSQNPNSKNEE